MTITSVVTPTAMRNWHAWRESRCQAEAEHAASTLVSLRPLVRVSHSPSSTMLMPAELLRAAAPPI